MDHGKGEPSSPKARRALHRFFELGILIKGIDCGLELVGGLLLLFLSPAAISGVLFFFVQGELKEDPTDLVANLLLAPSSARIGIEVVTHTRLHVEVSRVRYRAIVESFLSVGEQGKCGSSIEIRP
jgi:uncharacterized membrane protein